MSPMGHGYARIPWRGLLLLAGSCLLSLVVGLVLWPRLRHPSLPSPPAQDVVDRMPGYLLTLVDHQGRALSERPGHVRVMLDPFCGYRNLPSQRATSFTVDENGFRGGDRGPVGLPLAFVLGGSAAFGHGVERDEDTFASVLGRGSPRYRFVNAGVVGYESGQELGLMTHVLDRYAPRLYVVFDGWNDLFVQLQVPPAGHVLGVNAGLSEVEARLRAFHETRRDPNEHASPRPPDAWEDRIAHDPRFLFAEVQDEYVGNLLRMGAFARAEGAALLVVYQPEVNCKARRTAAEERGRQEFARYGSTDPARVAEYREMGRTAAEACARAGIAFLDASGPAFCDTDEELFVDAVHLGPRGHARLAGLIWERLESLPVPATAPRPPTAQLAR
jgi:GDSL-like Lipase/Acylhydrolase family